MKAGGGRSQRLGMSFSFIGYLQRQTRELGKNRSDGGELTAGEGIADIQPRKKAFKRLVELQVS